MEDLKFDLKIEVNGIVVSAVELTEENIDEARIRARQYGVYGDMEIGKIFYYMLTGSETSFFCDNKEDVHFI